MSEQVDAKKKRLGKDDALAMLQGADQLYAAKGKNVVHVDLKKDKPDLETIVPLMLGPTGNLRAPTLRRGRTLIVGFDATTYKELLA